MESHLCDIRDAEALSAIIGSTEPDIVFHLAAQPLVRTSYLNPLETFSTNIMGTAHVLDALRGLNSPRVAVMITTDKVYRNNEWLWPYREEDILGGRDPYSASKSASEHVIASYRDAFLSDQGIAIGSARAGNVIGGGDWSQDRLIPDAIRAWQAGEQLEIRHPEATRPWQHVLEPLAGYLTLATKLWQQPTLAGPYNFGPETDKSATVREVIEMARNAFMSGKVLYGNGSSGPHEAERLTLETAKATHTLGVKPRWTLSEAVARTMTWYHSQLAGHDARALCESHIAAYGSLQ
jgi:CDP-glucose 4,6-dehydratase